MTRANLAVAAQAIGDQDEVRTNLEISDRLFTGMPPRYRLESQIPLANVELSRGDASAALTRLEKLRQDLNPPPSVLIGALYYSALGEAYRRNRMLPESINAYRQAIAWGVERVHSLQSERERTGVLRTIENSHRGLVATILAASRDEAEALRVWQSFRALDALGDPRRTIPAASPVLWFLESPDGFVAWLEQNDQVFFYRFDAPREAVSALAARFQRECADPSSDPRRLRQDARQLYRWMIEPIASRLAPQDSLTLELDGALTSVPVQALISREGQYLGDRVPLLVSSGYAAHSQPPALGSATKALVIATPDVAGESAARFPPLPDSLKEAALVRDAFPNSTVLEGRGASIQELEARLPSADIVHFAGHGYADSENGALLFAPRDSTGADYELLRSTDLRRQDWSRCRLAVLSACATAAGETHGAHNPDSLVRALTRAGASRVAASLWNVDSTATTELMRAFYNSLASSQSPSQALRIAQTAVRRRAGWDHPYYWAGFQLYGTT